MKRIIICFVLLAMAGLVWAQVPMLKIEYQMNVVAEDDANNFLTFSGPVASAKKDQFDAVSGASKLESTFVFNYYRNDIFGKKLLPAGLRGLFLYPIAGDKTMRDDALAVSKNADGSISVRFIHRGTAYEMKTDTAGKFVFPGASFWNRKVGYIVGAGPQVIGADFSPNGSAASVDWAKVWDKAVAGGKNIGATQNKTGDIVGDAANSDLVGYEGVLQFGFDGKHLTIVGDLKILRK